MWQRWKAGVGVGFRLVGVLVVLSFGLWPPFRQDHHRQCGLSGGKRSLGPTGRLSERRRLGRAIDASRTSRSPTKETLTGLPPVPQ